MNFSSNDLIQIAGLLSDPGDPFSADNLVSYGATVIVKPGATLNSGKLVSGPMAQERLSGVFSAFPLAVEYGSEGALTEQQEDGDLQSLESVLDQMDDDDRDAEFGSKAPAHTAKMSRRAVRIRKRYARVLGRWRKNATIAKETNHPTKVRRAKRQFKRITRIWSKMGRRGIPLTGLTAPDLARRQVEGTARRAGPVVQDQAALESHAGQMTAQLLAQHMGTGSYFAGTEDGELVSDIRAETVGYLFGAAEMDFWGAAGDSVEVVSTDPDEVAELDEDLGEIDADDAELDAALDAGAPDDDDRLEDADEEEILQALERETMTPAEQVEAGVSKVQAQAKKV